MAKSLQTPGSVLTSLMNEYQLNPNSLARAISLSQSAVRQIISGKSKITVSTALRLSKFFGQSTESWLDIQRAVDLNEAANDKELSTVLAGISKIQKPSKPEAAAKTVKKTTLTDKRKKAEKVPGAKPSARKPRK
jgi:addiction module HigA family antidote